MTQAPIPIETLALVDVENAVRRALRGGLQPDSLNDFLATVDWSNQDRAAQPIREVLGMLEQFATEYAEADLTEDDYRNGLLGLLPVPAAGD